jgi:hypothetical protein
VRRETGKEYGVKASDDKDLASHIDPKPCGGVREDVGEASVGACAGRKLSLVNTFRVPTPWSMRKATRGCSSSREHLRPGVVVEPGMLRSSLPGNRDILESARAQAIGPRREGLWP